jgi:hypothetical protein
VQLGFNLSNRGTDTLDFSSILIYLETSISSYTQMVARCSIDLMDDLTEIKMCQDLAAKRKLKGQSSRGKLEGWVTQIML